MSNSEPQETRTALTGIGPIDWVLGWGIYLITGGIAFILSMFICVMIVVPQLGPDTGIAVFAVWFCITVYVIGKSK